MRIIRGGPGRGGLGILGVVVESKCYGDKKSSRHRKGKFSAANQHSLVPDYVNSCDGSRSEKIYICPYQCFFIRIQVHGRQLVSYGIPSIVRPVQEK